MNAKRFGLFTRLGCVLATATASSAWAAGAAEVRAPEAPLPLADGAFRGPANGATTVRVFNVAGENALFARLAAELRAQGFELAGEPERLPGSDDHPEAVSTAVHEALGHSGSATAILALAWTPLVVRIWIANARTGTQLFREVRREPRTDPDTAMVALWAVELLRATAFATEAQEPATPPVRPGVRATPPPQPSRVARGSAAAERLTLQLGPALLLSPGGLAPSYPLALGAHFQPSDHVGLEAEWLIPTSTQTLKGAQGAALVSLTLVTVGGFVSLAPRGANWSGQLGGGLAVAWLSALGTEAQPPLTARADHALAAGPYLRASLARRLASRFGLRVDLLSGLALPRPVIAIGDASVARWGRPWLAVQTSAEVAF